MGGSHPQGSFGPRSTWCSAPANQASGAASRAVLFAGRLLACFCYKSPSPSFSPPLIHASPRPAHRDFLTSPGPFGAKNCLRSSSSALILSCTLPPARLTAPPPSRANPLDSHLSPPPTPAPPRPSCCLPQLVWACEISHLLTYAARHLVRSLSAKKSAYLSRIPSA